MHPISSLLELIHFRATIRKEGKGGKLVTIPALIARRLTRAGWDRTWIAVRWNHHEWIAKARPRSKKATASVVISLPRRCGASDFELGDSVYLQIADPRPWRCTPGELFPAAGGLDWSAVAQDDAFLTTRGDELVIHTRLEASFALRRVVPSSAFWLLGAYQVGGSKTANANEFRLVNKAPGLIAKSLEQLELWGIARARVYLRGRFIHVHSSKPLMRMARAALTEIIKGDGLQRMTIEEVREFAEGRLRLIDPVEPEGKTPHARQGHRVHKLGATLDAEG